MEVHVEEGHTYQEYLQKYGKQYVGNQLWDFSEEDFTNGAIEPDPDIVYWKINVYGETRYYETPETSTNNYKKRR